MELQGLHYKVEAELRFTDEEVDLLLERAARHYDWTCQEAGAFSGANGAERNGFIAVLKIKPNSCPAVWTSRQVDLTLKILEPYYSEKREVLRAKLFNELRLVFEALLKKYGELNA
jgi:hypothetical protein